MAKKIEGYLKLQVPAGLRTPSPPIGPALGQRGLNIMEFCKAFNAKTQDVEKGAPCPTVITYLPGQVVHLRDEDAAGQLLPEEGGQAAEGLQTPGRSTAGSINKAQVREIAEPR
jgi:large subunit ribosomal protein L11